MNNRFIVTTILIMILGMGYSTAGYAWGTWGHQHINYASVFALPTEMRPFFFDHIDFIKEEAVVPDIRKYTINDKAEYPRHYIDIELYDSLSKNDIPKAFSVAYGTYTDTFRQQNGILPWYMQEMMMKLTSALKDGRSSEILFLAADLAHYLGDANMPLHTSVNHDGQFTGQKGIHGFWESQLPELFGATYNLKVDSAHYISDVTGEIWSIINHSHSLEDSLLLIERNVKQSFGTENTYKMDSKGEIAKNKYGSPAHNLKYASAYNKALHGMVEKQMRHAIQDVANFWYTAWVNAGKPDLNKLEMPETLKRNSKQYEEEYKLWQKKGKLPEWIGYTEY